jgi:hypothetical protein
LNPRGSNPVYPRGSQATGYGHCVQGTVRAANASAHAGATDATGPGKSAWSSGRAGIETVGRYCSRDSRSERHLNVAHVKKLEVLARNWIFVGSAEKANVVCVLEFLNASWIAAEFLHKVFHRPRVLHTSVN